MPANTISSGKMSAATNQPRTVAITELRQNLAEVIRQVQRGAEIIVTSHGAAVARLVPANQPTPRRIPWGALSGQIAIAEDFDETPANIIAAMHGDNDA